MSQFFQYLRSREINKFSFLDWLLWPQRILLGEIAFSTQRKTTPPSVIFHFPSRWWTSYPIAALFFVPSLILSVIFQLIAFCFPSQRKQYREFRTHLPIYSLIDQAYKGEALSQNQQSELQLLIENRAVLADDTSISIISNNNSEDTSTQLIGALNWIAEMRNTRTFTKKEDFQTLGTAAKTITINSDAFRLLHHAFEQRWNHFKATRVAKEGQYNSSDDQIDQAVDLWLDPTIQKEFSSLMIDALLCTTLLFASIRTGLQQLNKLNAERIITALVSQGQRFTYKDSMQSESSAFEDRSHHLFLFDFIRASTRQLYQWVRLHATFDNDSVQKGIAGYGLGRQSNVYTEYNFTPTAKEKAYEDGFYHQEAGNLFYLYRKQHNWFNKIVMTQATDIQPYIKGELRNKDFDAIAQRLDERHCRDFDLDRNPNKPLCEPCPANHSLSLAPELILQR
jgi:hypothetical protein